MACRGFFERLQFCANLSFRYPGDFALKTDATFDMGRSLAIANARNSIASVACLSLEDLAHSLPNWLLHITSRSTYPAAGDRADRERVWLPPLV
jgi:hypothetical protein